MAVVAVAIATGLPGCGAEQESTGKTSSTTGEVHTTETTRTATTTRTTEDRRADSVSTTEDQTGSPNVSTGRDAGRAATGEGPNDGPGERKKARSTSGAAPNSP
jgi:hypothetical protein